jgi:membrane associated rhomboid family serine protease
MIPIRDALRSQRFPIVTVSLIILNLLVFFYQGYLSSRPAVEVDLAPWAKSGMTPPIVDPRAFHAAVLRSGDGPLRFPVDAETAFVMQYGLVPAEFSSGHDLPPTIGLPIWLTLFTSMFLHGGLLHVLGNMLYLWVFGDNVEDAMGPGRFLAFYLLCGGIAGLSQLVLNAGSPIPLVGASGAIAGVLGAYLMLYPSSRILTIIPIFFFIRLISIPAVIVLGIWFLLQVVNSATSIGSSGGGVAWFAHIGGFAAGMGLVVLFKRRGVPLGLVNLVRRRPSI